ncbi:hypothetical protein OC508_20070 [Vibrio vulnificus]|nr:hypothetical protein [Vibrio vulnificus]EGR0111181.1 hypothetical protein [Vibrio vulnificus]EIF5019614.1 hypothetical protein [Vibrio vulnificus]EIN9358068.1 hypothetical protein [Vibrio vulnificus]EIO2325214.1 hypothetical protein [Vibrio vulnificus]EIO4070038.1 hypothetical protein [Vibrio vulnificus]
MFRKVLILSLLLFSSSAISSLSRVDLNLRWMKDNYTVIEEILSGDYSHMVIPTVNTLGEIWFHRDGGVSGEVSPLLVIGLTHHTSITLAVLSSKPDSFSKWLNELQGIVFTDFNGGEVERLTQSHEELVRALRTYLASNPQEDFAHYGQILLERVEVISVRSVD